MSKYIKKLNRERGGFYPCEICNKLHYRTPIRTKNSKHYYCSRECKNIGMSKYPAKPIKGQNKKCPICNREFYVCAGSYSIRKYCSYVCRNKAQENHIILICKTCGEEYKTYHSHIKWRGSSYCSKICQDIAATKRTGELSPKWKGGRTSESRRIRASAQWDKWRDEVFKRDDYTCQICGARNSKDNDIIIELHPHHIKSFAEYPDLRFETENGQTLCSTCHYKLHGNLNKGHKRRIKYKLTPKICPGCNEEFMAKSERHCICSHRCQSRLDRKKKRDEKARKKLF